MISTTRVLWAVFISLLLVLLPHTAWAFRNWEPEGSPLSVITSYVAAFAFEAAIAVLTHKLARHIEQTPRGKRGLERFAYRYMNPIAFGLLIATFVSALANLAHAVEFGRAMKIFTAWGIPPAIYSVAFGGILPLASLIFARVLSNVVDDEEAPNPEVEQAKATILSLRQQLRDGEARVKASEDRVKLAEDRARLAEERFGAIGDLVKFLFGEDKRQRIVSAHKQWPQLPGAAIAIIAGASPAYVSEVLKEADVIDA